MQTLLLVDGNSILNRAFYGVPTMTTRDGLYTNAVRGMMNILTHHLTAVKPNKVVVAFDVKAPTFRHTRYDGYKANRKGMPEELAVQLPYAKEMMRAMGCAVAELAGYEADDLLGSYAAAGAAAGCNVYVLTGDRDSLQLISEQITILLVGNKETTTYDRAKFFEKYGVYPEQFVDVKALMGDSSDNIPGVRGIGEKTACELIAEHGNLDGVYAALPDMKAGAKKTKLEAGKEDAYLSQFLARIATDAPLPLPLSETDYHGHDAEALLSLCRKLEFTALIDKLGLATTEAPTEPYTRAGADALLALPRDTTYTLFFADTCENGDAHLFVTAEGTRMEACAPVQDLLPFLTDSTRKLSVHDSKQVHRLCLSHGARFAACAFDLSLAAYLLAPTDSDYDLARLAGIYLSRSPATAEALADCAAELTAVLAAAIEEAGMHDLYYHMELPTAAVLADMEDVGFCVDTAGLAAFGARLTAEAERVAESIYLLAGENFNILSPKQLGEVLFERLGLPAEKKTKTGYATGAEVLERLRAYHPIVDMILLYRQLTKLASTYAEGLRTAADENGIIHSTFHQTVTATGRLSSSEPNLQNIPIRTELGREFRKYFVPRRAGAVLIDADYSQIELRLVAHLAKDERMLAAFARGADIHTATAAEVFGVPEEAVTPEMRKRAKAVNFGIVYGIGAFSLAADLGITRKQADAYIQSYFATYGGIKDYLDGAIAFAKEHGYAVTPFGRRRPIPELVAPKAPQREFGKRVAMNSPVQGMAADVMKLAMVAVHRALAEAKIDARLILQVHDELIVEADAACAAEAAEILRREMEHAVSLSVPLVAETAIGNSWFDCK